MEIAVSKYLYHSCLPANPHKHSNTDYKFYFGMSLASITDETVDIKQLYSKYNPRMTDDTFFGE